MVSRHDGYDCIALPILMIKLCAFCSYNLHHAPTLNASHISWRCDGIMVSMQDFSSLDPSSSAHHCVVFLGKTLLSLSVLLQTRVKHLGTSKISENSDTALVRINILTSSCKPLGLPPLTVSGISLLPYPQDIKIDNPNSFFSIFIINKIHKKPLPYLSQKKLKIG